MHSEQGLGDIDDWLRALGLGRYARLFSEHEIDAEALRELTDADLRELSIPLGPRKRILKGIRELLDDSRTRLESSDQKRLDGHPVADTSLGKDAQRRHLTIVFVDLVGSTSLARRLDPEDLAHLLHTFHEACGRVVERFGGFVAKHLGDGLIAYFGWPEAHENDAERAILAGLGLVESASAITTTLTDRLQVRVGIASGDVVVGEMADTAHARIDEVFGETPNLAARLQAIAAPDTVLVSAETFQLVQHKFLCLDLGQRELKGFGGLTSVYQVVGPRALASNFEARSVGGLTPLINRAEEVELLKSRWYQAAAGHGQVVLLVGEPGIGKSRLCVELHSSLIDQSIVNLSFQCSALHTDSPLYPVARCIGQIAALSDEDAPEDKRRKLESLFGVVEGNRPEISLLGTHLGIDVGQGQDQSTMSPERQRVAVCELLAEFIFGLARRSPVQLKFEDVHWVDPTTSEFLDVLISRIQQNPVLLILTSRPTLSIPWRVNQTVLTLNGLTRSQSALLVEVIVSTAGLSDEVVTKIAERSDGNPLYIEELAATVLGAQTSPSDTAAQAVAKIPATLQDSLLARIDRTSARAKELVQLCAVVGRRFSHEQIKAIYGGDEQELDDTLAELVGEGLLQTIGRPPQAEYSFRHGLIQDAAYSIILLEKRRRLHAACAKSLEEHFPSLCLSDPGTLGRHHEAADNRQAAAPYFLAAGQLAMERSALREANTYLQKGLSVLAAIPDSHWKQQQELKFRTLLGRVCIFAEGWAHPSVMNEFGRALYLCKALGLDNERVPLEWAIATYHLLRGEIQEAVQGGERVLALAEQVSDKDLLSVAHSALTIYRFYNGDFLGTLSHKDQALHFYRTQASKELQKDFGTDRRLQALRGAALAHWCLGDHQIAIDLDEEQRRLALSNGRPFEYAYALTISCILHGLRREAELTRAFADDAIGIALHQGFSFLEANARNFRALAVAMQEPSDATLQECDAAIESFQASGNRMGVSSMFAIMGEICGRIGQIPRGLMYIERALDYVRESGERFAESDVHRVKGELLRMAGESADARLSFERALLVARSQSARTLALAAAIPLARALCEEGEFGPARDLLQPLYDSLRQSTHIAGQLRQADAICASLPA